MKIVAIVQARMGSTRLPGKVLRKIVGRTVIELLLRRLSRSKVLTEIVVATSIEKENDPLFAEVLKCGYRCFRGPEKDVLGRFAQVASATEADTIVRITGDCPIVDAKLVDNVISLFLEGKADYVSNTYPASFPDGLDVEVFTKEALDTASRCATTDFDREHVTPYIRNGDFSKLNYLNFEDLSTLRLTLDQQEDLDLLSEIYKNFAPNIYFDFQEAVKFLMKNEQKLSINSHIKRDEGAKMGKGEKLYLRAKKIIPGGTSLLSKRPEMFLPERWPTYFQKAEGIKIWDLDGREYIDMGLMGVGTNTLGYANKEVDSVVHKVVDDGNMSSLNCYEELFLAERLIQMNPWADMVKFARSGGEANAIAVRIARAHSKSSKIAVCGYHGWHDWYLAANLGDVGGLDSHLLPGLEPNGVPKNLAGSVVTFEYNDLERLKLLIEQHEVGIVKMEVMRNCSPENNFLQEVRKLTAEKGIILIFDECSSGFRETFGGLFKRYNVEPDIAVFGKTLGNGYAITAVVGKEDVMQSAQSTFISSTFWTERIGPAAALKTLEIMEREESWEKITNVGLVYREMLKEIADKIGLPVAISGIPALTTYSVTENSQLQAKTYISQELLKRGFLASTAFYPSIMHDDGSINNFLRSLEPILITIAKIEYDNLGYESFLDGPICHSGFKRLN